MSLLCRLKNLVHKGVLKEKDLERIVIIPKEQEPCEDCISRAEAIEINKKYHGQMPNDINHQIWQELNDLPSIQPKPKTDVLDKIRAEIESNRNEWIKGEDAEWHTYDRCLLIIDKYKAESEDKE